MRAPPDARDTHATSSARRPVYPFVSPRNDDRPPLVLADWQAFRATVPDTKIAIAGERDGMRYIDVDERLTLGHYLEYFWATPAFLRAHPHRIPPSRRGLETP